MIMRLNVGWFTASFFAVATLSCAPARHPPPNGGEMMQPVIATAPVGIGDSYLGVPLDAHFRPLQGPTARTLFPATQITRYPANQVSHETVIVSDSFALDANLSAWHLFDVGGGVANDRRFASYRAFQIEFVSALDDRVPMGPPPYGASFYPWKIYYGHAYEAVFSGTSHGFHAGIAAEFQAIGGDLQSFARTRSLEVRVVGVGLTPNNGQAIFARTPNDIRASYSAAGPAVPIFAEYRLIPGTPVPPRSRIAWATPLRVEVVYDTIDVLADGTWGATPWTVDGFCAANGTEIPLTDRHVLPPGTRVEDGQSYPVGWHAFLTAVDGDLIDCGLDGRFQDTIKGGAIAHGRMPQPITLRGPGVASGTFEARNADTHYRIHYRLIVRR